MDAEPSAVVEPPGAIDPTDTYRVDSADGTELYGEIFTAPHARAIALVLHGYAEHCGRYREVAHVLNQLGHTVGSVDFRGHGRSAGQRGHVGRFTEYLDDADAALAELRRRGGADLPVLVVAHSNGGLIALRWLADAVRAPAGVYAAVLSSPFCGLKLQVSPVKSLLGRVASRVMPSLSLPNDLEVTQLTSDPELQRAREVDTLCHDVASARYFTEAMATHKWVLDFAHRLTVPNLWLVAGDDQIADPAAARAAHDRVRCPTIFKELAGMQHEVFNERDRAAVFAEIGPFVEAHFPS